MCFDFSSFQISKEPPAATASKSPNIDDDLDLFSIDTTKPSIIPTTLTKRQLLNKARIKKTLQTLKSQGTFATDNECVCRNISILVYDTP